ncbi:hypothetical protein BCEN4_1640006 [Burkholderia cenocepacia]|nr:hypothetical protein BCEN4_1640006 [Burkholderia cenocepacia]
MTRRAPDHEEHVSVKFALRAQALGVQATDVFLYERYFGSVKPDSLAAGSIKLVCKSRR